MQLRTVGLFSNKALNFITFSVAIALIFIIITKTTQKSILLGTPEETTVETETTTEITYDLSTYEVKTHKGLVNLEVLNEKVNIGKTEKNNNKTVFKSLGFEVMLPTLPIPTLRMTTFKEPTCATVFSEYLEVAEKALPNSEDVSDDSPKFHNDDFLMNGFAAFNETIFMPKEGEKANRPKNWDKISEMMELTKEELDEVAKLGGIQSMFSAMHMYPVLRMSGLIIGSVTPWLEVMTLQHGAQHILTLESNELEIEEEYRDRLSSMHPMEFANKWGLYAETFDFVATFGFIERSGLGRYREPMDPIGDLREIMKIKCVLKQGGLLYLGLPYGTDALQFQSQRIYGSLRLAMMFSGFEWVATFTGRSPKRVQLRSQKRQSTNLFNPIRYTFVLKKL